MNESRSVALSEQAGEDLGKLRDLSLEERERLGQEDERILIALIKGQDPAGLNLLVRKHHDKLFAVANRICNNPADSEEVLQDVYMTAMNKIDRFQERSTLSTWLYRITVNAALMKLRSQRYAKNTVDIDSLAGLQGGDDSGKRLIDDDRGPDDNLLTRELLDQIRDSVEDLPEIYQNVFFLRDIHGFSIKETSKMLHTTPAAIKSRLHRSRYFLQEKLKPYLSEN